jgi:hypothetical protein
MHNPNATTAYITPNLGNILNGYDPADSGKYTGTFNFANAFELSQNNSNEIYAVKTSLYKSVNRGDNWIRYNITGATNVHDILRIAKSNSNRIYVTENGTDIFQRSDDGGQSWVNITANKLADLVISDIVISQTNSLDIYITCLGNIDNAKVFHSLNGGGSWTNISTGLPNVDARCIVLAGNPENSIYVGNDFGVYYRDNNIGHWINFSNGLPIVFANHLVYDAVNNKISVATYGRGIWISDIYDVASCVVNRVLNGTYTNRNIYAASNDITSAGTIYGTANSRIKYSAAHQVILQPGFTAQVNSDFIVTLEGCDPAPILNGFSNKDAVFNNDSTKIYLKPINNIKKPTKPILKKINNTAKLNRRKRN